MITILIIFVVLVALMLIYFRLADNFNIIDKPNHRSSHTKITIRGGGMIFYFGLLLFYLCYGFEYPWLMIGATLIATVSFVDDMLELSPKLRLSVQFLSISMMLYQCGLTEWYWYAPAMVFAVGIINVYNFMDGINGITASYSLVVLAGLWFVNNAKYGLGIDYIDNHIFYTMAISLLIFSFYNFRVLAKCFAGDVGSVTIAFILCFIMGSLIIETGDFTYLIFLAVYGVDAVTTIVHRVIRGEKLTEAHRSHTYQILANELAIPQLVISSIFATLQLLIIVGYFLFSQYEYLYFVAVVLLVFGVNLWFRNKYFHLHKTI